MDHYLGLGVPGKWEKLFRKGVTMHIHSIRDVGRLYGVATMSLLAALVLNEQVVCAAGASTTVGQRDYHFDGTISRQVLENYLDRSVTMAYFLVTGVPEGNRRHRLLQSPGGLEARREGRAARHPERDGGDGPCRHPLHPAAPAAFKRVVLARCRFRGRHQPHHRNGP